MNFKHIRKYNESSEIDEDIEELKNIFIDVDDEGYTVTIGKDKKMSDQNESYFIINIFIETIPSLGMGNPYSTYDINSDVIDEIQNLKDKFDKLYTLHNILLNSIKHVISLGFKIRSYNTLFNTNVPRIQINLTN